MKRYLLFCLMTICFFSQSFGVMAEEARPLENNVAVEEHLQKLSEDLRCLVCQNQTLADSHADLALDLKQEIREMIIKGMSDQDIIDYLVARYGDFVLYRPPFKLTTLLLWVGPFLLLLIGAISLYITLKRRAKIQTDEHLDAEEKHKVSELLGINREL